MVKLESIRESLEKEKQQLEAELVELRKSTPALGERREGSPFGKREEEAAEAIELEKRMAMEKRITDLIKDIDHALEKFARGMYGICELCLEPISPERLEILPMARLCMKCKASRDREAKSRIHR